MDPNSSYLGLFEAASQAEHSAAAGEIPWGTQGDDLHAPIPPGGLQIQPHQLKNMLSASMDKSHNTQGEVKIKQESDLMLTTTFNEEEYDEDTLPGMRDIVRDYPHFKPEPTTRSVAQCNIMAQIAMRKMQQTSSLPSPKLPSTLGDARTADRRRTDAFTQSHLNSNYGSISGYDQTSDVEHSDLNVLPTTETHLVDDEANYWKVKYESEKRKNQHLNENVVKLEIQKADLEVYSAGLVQKVALLEGKITGAQSLLLGWV